jgi:uncharacterized membrane-anchored protein
VRPAPTGPASLGAMLVIAHAGHWAVSLIYLVPFVVVALWVVRDRIRHGRDEAAGEAGDER